MNKTKIEDLLVETLNGNEKAKNMFFKKSLKLIFRYLIELQCDANYIDDVAQETVIRLMEKLPNMKIFPKSYSRYLKNMTWFAFVDYYRKIKRNTNQIHPKFEDAFKIPDSSSTNPINIVERRENLNRVNNAICNLDKRQKDVIYLAAYNMTIRQIANVIKKSIGYTHNHLTRARNQLLQMFPEYKKVAV